MKLKRLTKESKTDILNNLTVGDVLNAYSVETADRGRKIRCPSPTHPDRHPSCQVYNDGVKCYSCGFHASPVGLVFTLEGDPQDDAGRLRCWEIAAQIARIVPEFYYFDDETGECSFDGDGEAETGTTVARRAHSAPPPPPVPDAQEIPVYLPPACLTDTWPNLESTDLFGYLADLFGRELAAEVCRLYAVGGSNAPRRWKLPPLETGDRVTVFPLIDVEGRLVGLKKMGYHQDGHRVKRGQKFEGCTVTEDCIWQLYATSPLAPHGRQIEAFNAIEKAKCVDAKRADGWVQYVRPEAPFGARLLNETRHPELAGLPVAVVESEKTCLLATCYELINGYRRRVWLSCTSMSMSASELRGILGMSGDRRVELWPDVDGVGKWRELAAEVGDPRVEVVDLWRGTDFPEGTKHDIGDAIEARIMLERTAAAAPSSEERPAAPSPAPEPAPNAPELWPAFAVDDMGDPADRHRRLLDAVCDDLAAWVTSR